MNQRHATRAGRICRTCRLDFTGTAAEIKAHAKACVIIEELAALADEYTITEPDPED